MPDFTNEFRQFTPPSIPVPPGDTASKDQLFDGQINIQIMACGSAIQPGHVAIILHNVQIGPVDMPDGTQALVPCFQLSARQAMEVAMNMIHIAKIAEQNQVKSDT